MKNPTTAVRISTHRQVNGIDFGASTEHLLRVLGPADQALENYTGELEVRYADTIYRFFDNCFVEATFPDQARFVIDDVIVLSVFNWLATSRDVVDRARFRVSLEKGLAYDFRNPEAGSITVFEKGRWDTLILNH